MMDKILGLQNRTNRERLASFIYSFTGNLREYGPAVYSVNHFLNEKNVELSDNAYNQITRNLIRISEGKQFQTTSSLYESKVFAKDAFDYLCAGRFRNALIAAAGAVTNASSSLYFAGYDVETLKSFERHFYTSFHL